MDKFTILGIMIAVLFIDALVCLIQITIAGVWKDKVWRLIIPLISNAIGFSISLAFHIFNSMR